MSLQPVDKTDVPSVSTKIFISNSLHNSGSANIKMPSCQNTGCGWTSKTSANAGGFKSYIGWQQAAPFLTV
jgi:hypothetical protein